MHLRNAAEGIGVLHMFFLPCNKLASFQKFIKVLCYGHLSRMCTDLVYDLLERLRTTVKSIQRDGTCDICTIGKAFYFENSPDSISAHKLSSVEQGKRFFGFEFKRRKFQLFQHNISPLFLTLKVNFSLSNQRKREMRKRRKVARS